MTGNSLWYEKCEILRLPNIIQPHFGDEGLPAGLSTEDSVTLYMRGDQKPKYNYRAGSLCWEHLGKTTDIMAYIVHKSIGDGVKNES